MEEPGKPPHRNRPSFRRRASEPSPSVSGGTYPVGEKVSPKHLGYLYAHCRLTVPEIVSRYPNRLTQASVHLGLHHYFTDKATYDAELKQEAKFSLGDSLKNASMRLPGVGLGSLVDVEAMVESACEAERRKASREREAERLRIKPQEKIKPS